MQAVNVQMKNNISEEEKIRIQQQEDI